MLLIFRDDRLIGNPRHSPTLRQLEKAAAALGKRLVLTLDEASSLV